MCRDVVARQLRVLLVTIDYPPPPGGIQTVTKNLEKGLNAGGHRSCVLHLERESYSPTIGDFIPHPRRFYGLKSIRRRDFVYMNNLYKKTTDRIKNFNPDIVHAMHINNWSSLVAAKDHNIPTVLSTHGLELKNTSLAKTAISDADLVHTPSIFTSDLVKDILSDTQTYVVPPSIDLDSYRDKL